VTGAVRLTGTIRCAPDEAERLRAAIPEHVALTRAEPGCVAFDIRATPDPCAFEVSERFRDAAAFEAHQARTRASAWWLITGHMPRDFEITRE
jgi:quinol monooxygenase YgiN